MFKRIITLFVGVLLLAGCSMHMTEPGSSAAASNESGGMKDAPRDNELFDTKTLYSADMTNLALGKPIKASSIYSSQYSATKAVDDDNTSGWGSSTEGESHWLYVDLGEISTVNAVGVRWFGEYYATEYSYYISNDGINWINVYTKTNGVGGYEQVTGEGNCRYVAILCSKKNSVAYGIAEFEVKTASIVTFTDSNLETLVRTAIDRTDDILYPFHLDSLENLDARYKSISTLNGIEHCKNLTELDLGGNFLINIAPLNALKSLTILNLSNNKIVTVSALTGLTYLKTLNLSDNRVDDITPLSGLTQLNDLNLAGNSVSDLGPVSAMADLQILNVEVNPVSSLTPLASLHSLRILKAGGLGLTDVNSLAGISSLEELHLMRNKLTDLSGLSGLTKLTKIHAGYNTITDMSSIASLTGLTFIDLSYNTISTLDTLTNPGQLIKLKLHNNAIQDLTPLRASFEALSELDVTHNNMRILADGGQGSDNLAVISYYSTGLNAIKWEQGNIIE